MHGAAVPAAANTAPTYLDANIPWGPQTANGEAVEAEEAVEASFSS